MSHLQIYNCGNIEKITNSLVITSKEQDMINSMGENLQLLYNNKIEKDTQERIKHAFINIFSKIFKHKGGKKERYSKKGGNGNNNELIIKDKSKTNKYNNITSYDFFAFFIFIIGIFILAIAIYQAYKFCNSPSMSDVSVIEEFRNTINDLTNEELGYLSYVWKILTGTTASVMSKKINEINHIILDELKDLAIEINNKAIKQCVLERPDSAFGMITNVVQTWLRSDQQATCIYNANINLYELERLSRVNSLKFLYEHKLEEILSVRDMIKYGTGLISMSSGYLTYRYKQLKNTSPNSMIPNPSSQVEQIEGGRKIKKTKKYIKRKTNKKKTNKKKTNKRKTNKRKTNKRKNQ